MFSAVMTVVFDWLGGMAGVGETIFASDNFTGNFFRKASRISATASGTWRVPAGAAASFFPIPAARPVPPESRPDWLADWGFPAKAGDRETVPEPVEAPPSQRAWDMVP